MPSWQWSYPYNASDTATVLFDATPANALYRWRAPHQDVSLPRQVLVETAEGGVRNYKVGQAGRLTVLRFVSLPPGSDVTATQLYGYLGLLRFLRDFTDFGQKTFGFYDHTPGATEREVRYVRGVETFTLTQGCYVGQIVLRGELT
jgi:hypothetical protein